GRHRGGFGGAGRDLVDGRRHFVDGRGRGGDFLGLVFGSIRQLEGGGARLVGCGGNVFRRILDARHQLAKLENRKVDGVGDGAGEVLGDRRLGAEIAVAQALDLIEQAVNRLLVAVVGGGGVPQAATGIGVHLHADQRQQDQR